MAQVTALEQSYSVNSYFPTDTAALVPDIFASAPSWSHAPFARWAPADDAAAAARVHVHEAGALAFLRAALPLALRAIARHGARAAGEGGAGGEAGARQEEATEAEEAEVEEEAHAAAARDFARRLVASRHAPRAASRGADLMFDAEPSPPGHV